jgi:hypothetical protein
MKETSNSQRKGKETLKIGDLVSIRKTDKQKIGDYLENSNFFGPYQITEKRNEGYFKLHFHDRTNKKHEWYNQELLRKYNPETTQF